MLAPDEWTYLFSSMHIPSGKLTKNYGKSPFLMGKSTIFMAIFNSYVKLPEGNQFQPASQEHNPTPAPKLSSMRGKTVPAVDPPWKRCRNIAHPVFMDMVGIYGWYIPQEHLEQISYIWMCKQMSTTRKVECDINSSDYP